MPDITVTPVTSKIVVDSARTKEEIEFFKKRDIPVLYVRANLPTVLTKDQIEDAVVSIDKTVKIDSEKKHILIGTVENSFIDTTDDLKIDENAEHFFKRWDETKKLFLAFNCFSSGVFICCIKGLWEQNRWKEIKFQDKFSISVQF